MKLSLVILMAVLLLIESTSGYRKPSALWFKNGKIENIQIRLNNHKLTNYI